MSTVVQAPSDIIGDDELYEVIDGKRVRTPPMGVFAVWIASQLHSHLAAYVRTQNLGRALTEALFHLPSPINRDRRPDVSFVSFGRWPKNRSVPRTDNAWDVVPNLAVEVVSPNDVADEIQEKIGEYFRVGVELVWVVYPMQSQVHVYASPTQITGLAKSDTLDGGTVVPGFRLPLAELFTEPEETADANGAARGS